MRWIKEFRLAMLAQHMLWQCNFADGRNCAFSVVWGYRIAHFSPAVVSVKIGAENLDKGAAMPGVAAVALEAQLSKKGPSCCLQSGQTCRYLESLRSDHWL